MVGTNQYGKNIDTYYVHKAAVRCVSKTVGENGVLTSVVLFVSPLCYYVLL
jgi:hypothetical protein